MGVAGPKRCAISFVSTNSPYRKLRIHDLARASARMSASSMRRGSYTAAGGPLANGMQNAIS
jgi:hypothetical protein